MPILTLDVLTEEDEPLVGHLVCAERDRPEWPVVCHPEGVDLVGILAH
jgi:hypothetical protein